MSGPFKCFAGAVALVIGLGPVAEASAQNFNRQQRPSWGTDGGRPYGGGRPNRPFGGGGFGISIDPGVFVEPRLPLPPRGQAPVFVDDEDDAPPRRVRRPRPRPEPAVVQPRPARQRPARVVEPITQPPRTPPRAPRPAPLVAAPRSPIIVPLASEQRLVEREVLIQLRDGLTERQVADLFRRQRLERLDSQRVTLIGVTLYRLRIPDQRTPRDVLRGLGGEARLAFAQPNYIYRLEQPETSASVAGQPITASLPPVVTQQRLPQYSIDKLDLAEVHLQSRGARIKIAVIDSGVDTAHPELAGALDKASDMLTGTAASVADADNHGTGMASALFARAQLTGVAPAASLLAARAFKGTAGSDRSGAQGTSWHVLKGIDWSVAEGARVLNLSFAGPRDELVSRTLAAASQRGVVAVAAAGNAGPGSPPLFPASDTNVIAVTALDANDKVFPMANRGRHIAVAAPGVDVLVAQTASGYGTTTGTSVATAHVSGLVALLIERDAKLNVAQVRSLLTSTARDLGTPGPDAEFGAGMINIRAALSRMAAPR
ncbi:MAG: S8 family serine peptidase [Bosea sp. (in: a-proteobacteria)]